MKYKLDNEFELVFVVGYQKSLPLNYLDKLLDEIQLRFRDKYAQDLKEFNFQSNFNDFSGEFETTRALVEKKCKEIQDSKQMGTFKEVKNYVIRLRFIFLIIQSLLMDHAGINKCPWKSLLFQYCFQKISYFSISSFVKP